MIQILVLLGMYFDAVVVFVTSQTLLFRLALDILWNVESKWDIFSNFCIFLENLNFIKMMPKFLRKIQVLNWL